MAAAAIPALETSRLKKLQALGVLCGFAAGAWLGAAEAPTKLVRAGIVRRSVGPKRYYRDLVLALSAYQGRAQAPEAA